MNKDLDSDRFWDLFGNGVIVGSQRPSLREAADTVIALMRERNQLREKVERLEKQLADESLQCNNAMMRFASEAEQLAHKLRRPS